MKVPALKCELSGEGCNDKEKEYVESYKSKSADDVAKEIARLTKMKNGKMKPELQNWLDRRVRSFGRSQYWPCTRSRGAFLGRLIF